MKLINNLRQLKFPKEFRIPETYLTGSISSLELLFNEILNKLPKDEDTPPPSEENNRFLADVATGLWRLRTKMINPDTGSPLEGMSRPFRHLESIWDAMAQANIEIIDHTNEPFDTGMSIKAVSFQPTKGLDREMIIETIKPTIYNGDTKIQMGEVIVGKPQNEMIE